MLLEHNKYGSVKVTQNSSKC